MYASPTTKFIVGIFVLLGIAALAILSVSLGKIELIAPPGYTLYANFDNIAGLKLGDEVELAGVKIGKVTGVTLDKNERARVALRLDQGVEVDTDAIAGVKSAGLLGDKYVSISLGAGERNLKSGQTIRQTQSSFVLEDAIGQFISNATNGGGKSSERSSPAIGSSDGGSKTGK
ncbi:MAG: outer membrane lipid asymmetry maintenance protein MlaD [Candidatus Binataceae bacterium]